MKVLMIDNFDSFTFNLEQYFKKAGAAVVTYRNDAGLSIVEEEKPDLIVLSPGPSSPQNAGMCMELVEKHKAEYPIFGVCLGMQVIAEVFGMPIRPLDYIINGKISGNPPADKFYSVKYNSQGLSDIIHGGASEITHDGKTIFSGLQNPFLGGRYHSLGAYTFADPSENDSNFPNLEISAVCPSQNAPNRVHPPLYTYGAFDTPLDKKANIVMGVRHKKYKIEGVQFHPESVLTMKDDVGMKLIENVMRFTVQ